MDTKKAELIFIPSPGAGHLASAVEAAKLLLAADHRLSISILIFKLSSHTKLTKYIDSLAPSHRFRLFNIAVNDSDSSSRGLKLIESLKPKVKEAVSDLVASSGLPLVGFVLDLFFTPMMDVGAEFGVPSYFFFTSSAAFLGFMLHLQFIYDEHQVDPTQFKDSDVLDFPTSAKPFPVRALATVLQKESFSFALTLARGYINAKGILVNSFTELESHAINYLSQVRNPPVYPVGPILNLGSEKNNGQNKEIIDWLENQPALSVVFLCFGSRGSFSADQVKEIACALEHCEHRFLWSLRRPSPNKERMEHPTDYEDPEEVLPAGFMERTAGIGKVIGWAPQAEILAHAAVGGFVSHCGWNSTLESIWFGVPIAAWPMYAEQDFNAFQLVEELELGVEIKMDYRKESDVIVKAEEIERGIRTVMKQDSKVRKNVKQMSEKSRMALMEGGSSISSLDHFIRDVMNNLP